jgi:hypothetical protein
MQSPTLPATAAEVSRHAGVACHIGRTRFSCILSFAGTAREFFKGFESKVHATLIQQQGDAVTWHPGGMASHRSIAIASVLLYGVALCANVHASRSPYRAPWGPKPNPLQNVMQLLDALYNKNNLSSVDIYCQPTVVTHVR